jgi:hypothetical protein
LALRTILAVRIKAFPVRHTAGTTCTKKERNIQKTNRGPEVPIHCKLTTIRSSPLPTQLTWTVLENSITRREVPFFRLRNAMERRQRIWPIIGITTTRKEVPNFRLSNVLDLRPLETWWVFRVDKVGGEEGVHPRRTKLTLEVRHLFTRVRPSSTIFQEAEEGEALLEAAAAWEDGPSEEGAGDSEVEGVGSQNSGSGPDVDAEEGLGTRWMTIGPWALSTKATANTTSKKN